MKNYYISAILDAILIAVGIFFLCLAVLRYASGKILLPLIVSAAISLSISALYVLRAYKKNKAAFLKSVESKKLLGTLAAFETLSENKTAALFMRLFALADISAKKKNNAVILKDSVVCRFYFRAPLSREKLAELISLTPKNFTLYVFCASATPEAALLSAEKVRTKIIDGNAIFMLEKKYGFFFEPEQSSCKTKDKLSAIFKQNFTKKKAAAFFVIGCTLLLFSSFSFFPVYYIVSGTLVCAAAFACLLFGKSKPANDAYIEGLFNI